MTPTNHNPKSRKVVIRDVRPDMNLVRQQRGNPNARVFVADHHENIWMAANGERAFEAQSTSQQSQETALAATKVAKKAHAKLDNTDQYEHGSGRSDANGDTIQQTSTPYSEWDRYHLVTVITLLIASFVLLALGAINVAVTILGSGIPAFLENPLLAYLLGAIVPATALATKSGYHLCNLDRSRHRYAWTTFILAGLSALTWLTLFALTFEGSSGAIDFTSLAEDAGDHDLVEKARTLAQILAEILVGSSLFLIIDRIHSRYAPTSLIERAGWRELKENADQLQANADVLVGIASADNAVEAQYKAALAVFVQRAVSHLNDI